MYGRDPLGLGFQLPTTWQEKYAKYHPRNFMSARAYARAAGWGRIGIHGAAMGLGLEWVPDVPRGYEKFSKIYDKGPKALREYFEGSPKGSWRFLGLRGPGGRIAEYRALRAAKKGILKAGWEVFPLMDMMGVYFTAKAMKEGYNREGLWGATKAGAGSLAEWGAFEIIFKALGGVVGGALTIGAMGAAGVYGTYKALDYGAKHARKTRALEFGGQPVEDMFGTIATMRQRSLLEMQKSHAALRGALGNEAQYMHIA